VARLARYTSMRSLEMLQRWGDLGTHSSSCIEDCSNMETRIAHDCSRVARHANRDENFGKSS